MYRQNIEMNMNPPIQPVTALHMSIGSSICERWMTDIPVVVIPLMDSKNAYLMSNPKNR